MKNIINASCNDEEFRIVIDGDNIDLLTAISEILRKIEEQNNITVDTSMKIIKKMLEV
ncbi:hypothetical protein [Tissierella creatinophila]|uniref:Uncharacterized protein n=1 Tax=Tissierella creatinophila DSM 6911 TaxID=1123403 RepID=A0A1U7M6T1_TISCR|nr:hypothetical protein [Tissierella creatinophila]OLS02898.1 hypothetical protein TICRE_10520 [Tissierella creatinophila DSM 6911]